MGEAQLTRLMNTVGNAANAVANIRGLVYDKAALADFMESRPKPGMAEVESLAKVAARGSHLEGPEVKICWSKMMVTDHGKG